MDADTLLDPKDGSGLEAAARKLHTSGEAADQEYMDPESDLKVHGMDLVLKIRERRRLFEVKISSLPRLNNRLLSPNFACRSQ